MGDSSYYANGRLTSRFADADGTLELSKTTQARVAERIREEILGGQIAFGSRLLQNEIATRLNVSSTPVREAFRELAAEGLVKVDARRGAIVCDFDAQEFLEVTELLALIEPANLLVAVPKLTEDIVAEATRVLDRMDRAKTNNQWIVLNRAFHLGLAQASDRHHYLGKLSQLFCINGLYVHRVMNSGVRERREAQQQHRDLLEACREGNPDKAARLAIEHIEPTLAHLRIEADRESRQRDKASSTQKR